MFDVEVNVPHYYVFAMKNEKADFTIFNEKFSTYNEEYHSTENLRSNPILTNEGYQLLTVRQFENYAKTIEYIKGVKAVELITKKMNVTEPYIDFAVSIDNFKKILKDKKIEEYYKFYRIKNKGS